MLGLKRFISDDRGATAIIFSLALVPLIAFVGAAIDYARAANARTKLQAALDATALALVRDAGRMNDQQLGRRAETILAGMFRPEAGVAARDVSVTREGQVIRVQAGAAVPTAIMGLLGYRVMDVGGVAQATAGNRTIELALVLDNTGSMGEIGKMKALKDSAHVLLDELDRAAGGGDRVSVSVVPYDTQVRLPASERNQPWLRPLEASEINSTTCGQLRINAPGTVLPRTGPDPDRTARNAWTGYVTDRDRVDCDPGVPSRVVDMNVKATAPDSLKDETLYPMVASDGPGALPEILPLTRRLGRRDGIRDTIEAMRPRGFTNIALGAMWGLETLSPGAPLTGAAAFGTPNVDKIMIILTDGWNTRDSFTNVSTRDPATQAAIDERTTAACAAAKASGVTVFTIRLMEGKEDVLRACASRVTDPRSAFYRGPGMPELFYNVENTSQLTGAFRQITSLILQTRLTQ